MIDIKDLVKDETYFECDYGMCVKFVVVSEPKLLDGRWTVEAMKDGTDEMHELICSVDFPLHGPKIYDYQAYTGPEDF